MVYLEPVAVLVMENGGAMFLGEENDKFHGIRTRVKWKNIIQQ